MKKSKYQNRYLKQTFKLKTTLNEKKKKKQNNRKPYKNEICKTLLM